MTDAIVGSVRFVIYHGRRPHLEITHFVIFESFQVSKLGGLRLENVATNRRVSSYYRVMCYYGGL